MTPKQVLRINLIEIPNLEIACDNCEAAVTFKLPKDSLPRFFSCPGCNKQLWGEEQDPVFKRLFNVMRAISDWQRADGPAFELSFSLTKAD